MQSQTGIQRQAASSLGEWGSDGKVSLPTPVSAAEAADPYVDMGGFRFTSNGLQPNISREDIDEMLSRRFAPYTHNEQHDDLTMSLEVGNG